HNDKQHNHFPDPDEILITEIIEKIRHRVINEHLSAGLIYGNEVARGKFTHNQLARMPSFKSLKSALYLARSSTIPIIPKTYGFSISSLYRLNGNGENFLLADRDSTYFDRILMFSSNRQLEIFFKSEVIFCDGTFASAPPQFEQIYTIHAVYEDEVFPCVFALCTHKNTQTYITIMEELKSAAERMNKQFAPSLIMSDFEGGFIRAVNQTYSRDDTRHVGCYFHMCQAIYRKVQEIGVQIPYNSKVWVRNVVRSLMAVPLLYQNLIHDQFDHIVNTIVEREKEAKKIIKTANDSNKKETAREEKIVCGTLRDLFNYFERYWINTVTPTMFCVQGLQHRTNNSTEGIFIIFLHG
ncbi:unnamed protein product, partial [Rotaria magnacalcarata]